METHGGPVEATTGKLWKIGDLARRSGKSVRALHLYEELGLLTPTARTHGGFRLYDETAHTRIRWIELLQDSGFSLHQIQTLLQSWNSTRYGPEAMAKVREIFGRRLSETRESITRFRALEKELLESLDYLSTCQQCHPPRTTQDDCPKCPEDHGMREEPALVAGFHSGGKSNAFIPLHTEERS